MSGMPSSGPRSPLLKRWSAAAASASAPSGVRVTKALSAGFSRSIRLKKCFRFLDYPWDHVQPGCHRRRVSLVFLVVIGFGDLVGPQTLVLAIERMGHGQHAFRFGARQLIDKIDDAREA